MPTLSCSVIDAIDHRRVDIGARRRNEYFLGTRVKVNLGFFLAGEFPCAFQHHIDVEGFPGQIGGILFRERLHPFTVDNDGVIVDFNRAAESAVYRIEARQVRVDFGIPQVIDGNDLDVISITVFIHGAQDIASDPSVAIDCDAKTHGVSSGLL
jgi:hypothetical protein